MKQVIFSFKAKLFPIFICCLVVFVLLGCSALQESHQIQRIVPVPQVQFVEATLIEGKTTKQEVLDIFGMPEEIDNSLDYTFRSGDIKVRLSIIQKDGTKYNVILGPGEKYTKLSIMFYGYYNEQGKNIPSNINTGIAVR